MAECPICHGPCLETMWDTACPHCADGLLWDPRVQGNVVSCHHCAGTGYVQEVES